MRPKARKEFAAASREFLEELVKQYRKVDPRRLAHSVLSRHFSDLTKQQRDLLTLCLLGGVVEAALNPPEWDLRAREMLEDFARFVARKGWAVQPGAGAALFRFGTKRAAETVVIYTVQRVDERVLGEVLRQRGGSPRVILLALTGIEPAARTHLHTMDWVDWFDLATHQARRSWHRDTVAFRRHLASHWGLHLSLE